jgi:hypothetical protein
MFGMNRTRHTARGPVFALFALIILIPVSSLWPQNLGIDVPSQYKLYLRILTFDRALKERVGDELVIGILTENFTRESRDTRDEMIKAISSGPKDLEGIPIRWTAIDLLKDRDLGESLARESVDVLYVTPIRIFSIGSIAEVCRKIGISTFTGVPAFVEGGIAVSFSIKGRSAEIIINLRSAKAEGSDFSSRLLDLATVVDKGPKEGGL